MKKYIDLKIQCMTHLQNGKEKKIKISESSHVMSGVEGNEAQKAMPKVEGEWKGTHTFSF